MLAWLRNLWKRPTRRAVRLAARYDAAATTAENRRHWAAADNLSAAAAHTPAVRRTLRNRTRYEVANNSYARGIVCTLANDLIGRGPRLQLLTPDADGNRRVEAVWHAWATEIRLAEKLRTMRMARAQDGEAFAVLTTNPDALGPIQLDLRLLEADQVAAPLGQLATDPGDGIEYTAAGAPAWYTVQMDDPNAAAGSRAAAARLPAAAVLHWYRMDRPGQLRGVPDLTPALPLFAQLRRYTLATLAAAETAADLAAILYTDAPPGGEADGVDPFTEIPIESRSMLTMPGGWKMEQFQATQPTSTYPDFKHELLNEIARCLNMPFNVAAGNSSSYNYSSGRLDHQVYHKAIRVDQDQLATAVLRPLLMAWLDEALFVPGLLPTDAGPLATWPYKWFWDGWQHVDPLKEAEAQAVRLANHTTTLADEYAQMGLDWETQIHQRAREVALMHELGLTLADAMPARLPAPNNEEATT